MAKIEVFLKKDIPKVGMAQQIIKVSSGYANNFIIPGGFGDIVTDKNREFYLKKEKKPRDAKAAHSETSLLAEKISDVKLTIKHKVHDDGKLYASIRPAEIVDLLAEKGFSIDKSQVKFGKPVKTKGTHTVTIKLSSKLQPTIALTVVPE
jgi:large subunit ribosomal protein L9